MLAPDGKRVRCSECQNDWFQLPEPEEGADEKEAELPEESADEAPADEDSADEDSTPEEASAKEAPAEKPPAEEAAPSDIPEGVKPKHEDDADNKEIETKIAGIKGSIITHLKDKKNRTGYGIAGVIFLFILIILVVFAQGLTNAWTPMRGFYNVIGVNTVAPGQGLSFERLVAKYEPGEEDNTGRVMLSGDILNLASAAREIPAIKASLVLQGNAVPIEWLITPPEPVIKGESSLSFTSHYNYAQSDKDEAKPKNITVRFDLNP